MITEKDIGRRVTMKLSHWTKSRQGVIRSIAKPGVKHPVAVELDTVGTLCFGHDEVTFLDAQFTTADIGAQVYSKRFGQEGVIDRVDVQGPYPVWVILGDGSCYAHSYEQVSRYIDHTKQTNGTCPECNGTGTIELFNQHHPCSKGCKS